MNWARFDGWALVAHIVAAIVVALIVLASDHGLKHMARSRTQTLCWLVFAMAVVGGMVYALLFDSLLIEPFDWKGVGDIALGGGFLALAYKYLRYGKE